MYHPEAKENLAKSAQSLVYQGETNFIFGSNSMARIGQINYFARKNHPSY
jgi:hypothetical protein